MYNVEETNNLNIWASSINKIDAQGLDELYVSMNDCSFDKKNQKIVATMLPDSVLIDELKRRYECTIDIFSLNE